MKTDCLVHGSPAGHSTREINREKREKLQLEFSFRDVMIPIIGATFPLDTLGQSGVIGMTADNPASDSDLITAPRPARLDRVQTIIGGRPEILDGGFQSPATLTNRIVDTNFRPTSMPMRANVYWKGCPSELSQEGIVQQVRKSRHQRTLCRRGVRTRVHWNQTCRAT